MSDEIINRVASSGLITLDLADFHVKGERVCIDIRPQLWRGMVLREQDFRDWVRDHDWSQYAGKLVAVTCSADAIVPVWAYMLIAAAVQPFCAALVFGDLQDLENELFRKEISQKIDPEAYRGKKIVIKGCGDIEIPVSAFVELTRVLRPVADKIMYGEPCSTVPVFRR